MILCDYCQQPARLVGGDTIYPHRPDLRFLRFWQCLPCGAYVGCHKGTERPLGRLANAELRAAKIAAHDAFDPKWRFHAFHDGYQAMTRREAYKWLAEQMDLPVEQTHIGMFNVEQCKRVVEICATSKGALTVAD